MENAAILQTLSLALFLGIFAQVLSEWLRLPSIILLMAFGVAAGPDGLGLLMTGEMGEITSALISLGVAIILFEGGMTLNLNDIRLAPKAIFNIIVFGPLITLAIIAVCLHYLLALQWSLALLTGSILTVSGPTVIGPLLKRVRVRKRLKDVLNWESIMVDAIGAILAVVMLNFIAATHEGSGGGWADLGGFVLRLGVGVAMGLTTGKVLGLLVERKLVHHEHANLAILSLVLLAYWGSNQLAHESGLLTVTVAGLILAQRRHRALREIKHFKDQLSLLTVSVLFILLAAGINLDAIAATGLPLVYAVLAVLFIARPLMILVTTTGTRLVLREKLFLAWVAPRGIIAAATASLFALTLKEMGMAQAELVQSVVFVVIMVTVVLQGFTANLVARLLGVSAPPKNGYLIVGIHPFSIAVATQLQQAGIPVKLIDNDSPHIDNARDAGLTALRGNPLDETTLVGLGLDEIGALLAMTDDDHKNTLACHLGQRLFGIDNAYQVINTQVSDITDAVLANLGGQLAFNMKLSVAAVNQRLENGRLSVDRVGRRGPDYTGPERLLYPLFIIDGQQARIVVEDTRISRPELIGLIMT